MTNPTARRPRFYGSEVEMDSTAPAPASRSDLLSRKPADVEPQPASCGTCGAPTLRAWANDPEFGSRRTHFDPDPVEDGRWFMTADGSLTWDPSHGTHRLHDCTRPAAQLVAEVPAKAVA